MWHVYGCDVLGRRWGPRCLWPPDVMGCSPMVVGPTHNSALCTPKHVPGRASFVPHHYYYYSILAIISIDLVIIGRISTVDPHGDKASKQESTMMELNHCKINMKIYPYRSIKFYSIASKFIFIFIFNNC